MINFFLKEKPKSTDYLMRRNNDSHSSRGKLLREAKISSTTPKKKSNKNLRTKTRELILKSSQDRKFGNKKSLRKSSKRKDDQFIQKLKKQLYNDSKELQDQKRSKINFKKKKSDNNYNKELTRSNDSSKDSKYKYNMYKAQRIKTEGFALKRVIILNFNF